MTWVEKIQTEVEILRVGRKGSITDTELVILEHTSGLRTGEIYFMQPEPGLWDPEYLNIRVHLFTQRTSVSCE